jgi:hypothetical protein
MITQAQPQDIPNRPKEPHKPGQPKPFDIPRHEPSDMPEQPSDVPRKEPNIDPNREKTIF